ncbi:UNVERIFIED_CONTAM: hypothetical protein PYX00_000071 [Menopon gallinae]|uniref:G-patch domain-containing protein n=1 Tax=Menopon gallinae TaxID=328185 RepID=A0AAW2I7V6_9NEOP
MTGPVHDFPFKIFVREQSVDETKQESPQCTKYLPVQPLTGESAKAFYESIINEIPPQSSAVPKKFVRTPIKRKCAKPIKFTTTDLLKLAQNNEYEKLDNLLRENGAQLINSTDNFGWTALMCASCSGAKESVQVLIKYKADPTICDKFGNNAFSLAKKKNYLEILKVLDKQDSVIESHLEKKKAKSVLFFCKACDQQFDAECTKHESSTLHQFNTNSGRSRTFYGIPESNKGFQMLLKHGWNREKGLGPKECGVKFPIKVTKKNDRTGIGCVHKIMSNKTDANNEHSMTKKERQNHERREKNFERNFRLQFS